MRNQSRILNYAFNGIIALSLGVVLWFLIRIFMFDTFPVNSDSMTPTIQPGDRILVNKMIFGARLYKNLDFFEGKKLESRRVPGIRDIRHDDFVVFNHVRNKELDKIVFNFSDVFVKRCVGLPGDTLSIRNGFYRNSAYPGNVLGVYEYQRSISGADSARVSSRVKRALKYAREEYYWTIFEMGPLYIPQAGSTIGLDTTNYNLFRLAIEYETDTPLVKRNGRLFLGERQITEYTFLKNYYFMAGDNVLNSSDSRYWGFVPEEFIIGVVPRLWTSRDPSTGKLNRNRIFKRLG